MADYPILLPTLSALKATKDDPQGTEAANKLDDAIRQTRQWCYDFLSTVIDEATGKIKNSAFSNSSFPSGFIRGSNPVDDSQREILQGSIRGIDLSENAVGTKRVKDQAITREKLALGAVGRDQIEDGAVSSAKLANQTIQGGQIADNTITGRQLANGGISAGNYGERSIGRRDLQIGACGAEVLDAGVEGQILVGGNGNDGRQFLPKSISGAITISKDGLATLQPASLAQILAYTRVAEKGTPGDTDGGGASTVTAWNMRGKGDATTKVRNWSIDLQTSAIVRLLNDGKIYFLADGLYLITISCPAFKVDSHKCRVIMKPSGHLPDVFYYEGTSEFSASAGAYAMTRSQIQFFQKVDGVADPNLPYFYVEHYTVSNAGGTTDALGKKVGVGGVGAGAEYYAIAEILKMA